MRIKVEKITDGQLMRKACEYTINAKSKMTLDKIYQCEHSPMRTQMFVIEMIDIPTFVSVHFVRHKVGIEHFVKSNRDDRGADFVADRNTPVNHMMFLNAEALITMAKKRLCYKAHQQTIVVMNEIKREVNLVDPDLARYMVKNCVYRGGCFELKSCGWYEKLLARADRW
jgi:hypothetical protein